MIPQEVFQLFEREYVAIEKYLAEYPRGLGDYKFIGAFTIITFTQDQFEQFKFLRHSPLYKALLWAFQF